MKYRKHYFKNYLKIFAIFTRTHLFWSLFAIKLQVSIPETFFRRDSNTGLFSVNNAIFWEHLFSRTSLNGYFSVFFIFSLILQNILWTIDNWDWDNCWKIPKLFDQANLKQICVILQFSCIQLRIRPISWNFGLFAERACLTKILIVWFQECNFIGSTLFSVP